MATNYLARVVLFAGVPLFNDYKDTIMFNQYYNSVDARIHQLQWFSTYQVGDFSRLQYVKVGENRIRLEGNAENYYKVNYCYFQNAAHNATGVPEYFFAFVLKVEYINDNVFEIEYEIDVMQTWQHFFVVDTCFVEREHTDDDSVGANLIAEPVEIGDYVIQNVDTLPAADAIERLDFVLVSTPLSFEEGGGGGGTVNQCYVGAARTDDGHPEPGDQTGHECEIYSWSDNHNGYSWYLLRPNSLSIKNALARGMINLCNNDYIGYELNPGSLGYTTLFSLGSSVNWNPSNVHTNCVTNCAQAVYFCCKFAGINPSSLFNTGNEYDVLMATGLFTGYQDPSYTRNMQNMQVGDILVTPTAAYNNGEGHTAIVVSIQ